MIVGFARFAASALLLLAPAAVAATSAPAPGAPRVRYFKEVLPTSVAPDRIAVQLHAGASEPWSTGRPLHGQMTLDPSGLHAPGWSQCTLDVEDRKRIETALARDPDVVCVSPVLLDEHHHARIPTSRLIVAFESHVSVAASDAIVAAWALGDVLSRAAFGLANTYLIETHRRDGAQVLHLADQLTDLPAVRYAESDCLLHAEPGGIPNDPLFESAWGLHNIGQAPAFCSLPPTNGVDADIDAPEAWGLATGARSVLVVIIDNGTQIDHPDLLGDPALGFDPTGENGGGFPVLACDNHGTLVAGCVSALRDNDQGAAGIASGVSFASARISTVGPSCSGWTVQPSWVADSLAWSQSIGARVTNTSWSFQASSTITAAYDSSAQAGLLHFACSHNQSASSVTYPASLASVVAVGGIAPNGSLASFSNFGADQELVAPAKDIVTTDRTGAAGSWFGDYACSSGTSFASPMAAGVAALMLSVNPALSSAQVRTVLQTSAVDFGTTGWDPKFGWGLVNAPRAVLGAQHPGDLDFSGFVDGADLAILLGAWQSEGPHGDINADGTVDAADLALLLGDWSASGR